ncbi:sugar transferase [Desulfonema ishimotonii]|uniref:Sugar transferase n=1 Tax=Desulfonema ishimotonii TaxID=45657 RepID=A0A401FVC6_9BACT|nr:sugar transferase [Desulfonema ishimotonii]GBC60915.1 sugar transferase [Desulfonema ishimotonii]
MLQQQVHIINTVLMILDALCIIIAGYGAFYFKYCVSGCCWVMDTNVFVASVMFVMFLNNYVMGQLDLYDDIKPSSHFRNLRLMFKAVFFDFLGLATGVFFFKVPEYSREFMLMFGLLSFIFIALQRFLSHIYIDGLYKKEFNVCKILVVGGRSRCKIISDVLSCQLSWGHEVVGRLGIGKEADEDDPGRLGTIEDLPRLLRDEEIDEVVFAINGSRSVDLMKYLRLCKKMGIPSRILPSLWQPLELSLSVEKCQDIPFLTVPVDNFNATGLLYKRILDLIGGLVGTLLFVLMYPFIAIAIRLDSPGPTLFRQKRVGQHGRSFYLYKFRTMYADAEARKKELMAKNEMKGAMFKLKNDPRITRVGVWLRKTSLDEFPQFLNVMKGEMSLVGTRPPTPDEVETYLPGHLKRISAKPGITGMWQISGRNQITDFEKVVELDCMYLDHWRFLDDLRILFKTIVIVLKRKGAI